MSAGGTEVVTKGLLVISVAIKDISVWIRIIPSFTPLQPQIADEDAGLLPPPGIVTIQPWLVDADLQHHPCPRLTRSTFTNSDSEGPRRLSIPLLEAPCGPLLSQIILIPAEVSTHAKPQTSNIKHGHPVRLLYYRGVRDHFATGHPIGTLVRTGSFVNPGAEILVRTPTFLRGKFQVRPLHIVHARHPPPPPSSTITKVITVTTVPDSSGFGKRVVWRNEVWSFERTYTLQHCPVPATLSCLRP